VAISVRLPPRVEQQLAQYCVSRKLTKSEAVKRALEQLFAQAPQASDAYRASEKFRGSDKTRGDVALKSKRLLQEYFRNKGALG
jgi:hypothetical protein